MGRIMGSLLVAEPVYVLLYCIGFGDDEANIYIITICLLDLELEQAFSRTDCDRW